MPPSICSDQPGCDKLGLGEPLGVYVHEGYVSLDKGGRHKHVAQDVAHEHGRAGSYEGDLWHMRCSPDLSAGRLSGFPVSGFPDFRFVVLLLSLARNVQALASPDQPQQTSPRLTRSAQDRQGAASPDWPRQAGPASPLGGAKGKSGNEVLLHKKKHDDGRHGGKDSGG